MTTSFSFGDIFSFNDEEYIFFAPMPGNGVYAAKILSKTLTEDLEKSHLKALKRNNGSERNIAYCYVILKTSEFESRAAHYGQPQHAFELYTRKLPQILNKDDLQAIQKDILESGSAEVLKEAIRNIIIE